MFRTIVSMLERLSSFIYRGVASSFVPTMGDVEAVKTLTRRLMGRSAADTLNNVLEWLERNVVFWWERAFIDVVTNIFLYIGVTIIALLILIPTWVLLFVLFATILRLSPLISLIASSATTVAFLLYLIVKMPPFSKLLLIILGSVALYNFVVEIMLKTQPVRVEMFTEFLKLGVIYWIAAGGSLFALTYLSIIYLPLANRLENVSKFIAIIRLIDLTFTPGLSASDVLSLRRGICRDYARLTASMLVNLFPDHRIYFILIPRHVATGVEVNGRIYVLDQRLPVMPLSTWLNNWKRSCPSRILLLQRRDDGTFVAKPVGKRVCVEALTPFSLGSELEKLAERTFQAMVSGESKVSYRLPGYARLFGIEDEVVYVSLIRKIKLDLERELVPYASLIKSIGVSRQGDDLLIDIGILTDNEQCA